MLKKVIKFNAGDFGVIAAAGFGLFLVLQIIITTVMLTVKPDTVPTLCGILVPVILGFILVLFFISNLVVNFDFLLRSSVTRRTALGSMLVLMVLEAAEAAVLSLLLGKVDVLIARAWAADLNEWTQEDVWRPHTTLLYAPGADLAAIAAAMQQEFAPFTAQVDRIEFSQVNGEIKTIDFAELNERRRI